MAFRRSLIRSIGRCFGRFANKEDAGRANVEKTQRQLADRLALATRAGGVGIWELDVLNDRLGWDEQMNRLYGIAAEQFGGAFEAWEAGIHPQDRQRWDSELAAALLGEKDFDTEFRVLWPDGSTHFIRALALVERDGIGRPLRMIGTNWDITATRRAEEILKTNEANFRAFFETISDMVAVGSKEGRLLFANAALPLGLGYGPEEMAGMGLLGLWPLSRRGEAEALLAALSRDGHATSSLPLEARDGSLIPVETRAWTGEWDGQACVFSISKNLGVEQEAQRRFERMFRGNPALMSLATLPEGRLADVNDAFLRSLGYSMEEIVGRTADELGLVASPGGFSALAKRIATEGRLVDRELQLRRKDGALLEVLFSGESIGGEGQASSLSVMIPSTFE